MPANSPQKPVTKKKVRKPATDSTADTCTISALRPRRSDSHPQRLGATRRMASISDIRVPMAGAARPSDCRYSVK